MEAAARAKDSGKSVEAQGHEPGCFCAQCRGEETPPATGNTGGVNRQETTTGGVDTLEVWIHGSHDKDFFRLLPELQQSQEYAKHKATQQHASVTVSGRRVHVMPRGVVKANGTLYFDLRLEWDGLQLFVMSDTPGDRGEVAFLSVNSFRLMRDGHQACWEEALELLRDLGISYKDSMVARIDACVDLPGVDIELFCDAYKRRDFIGRAKSGGLYDDGVGFTGFTRGKGGVLVRAYDKLTESKKSTDWVKGEVLRERRWGGVVPECATRVEFQLRREWLATWHTVAVDGMQGEAKTVEQVFDLLPTITSYLVEHWFRLVDDAERYREHGNQARAEASQLWQRVCEAFANWVEGEVVKLVRRSRGEPEDEALLQQLTGLVASVAAKTPKAFPTARKVLQSVMDRVEKVHGEKLLEKIGARRRELDAAGRARFLGVPISPLMEQEPMNLTGQGTEAPEPELHVCLDDLPF